MQKMMDIYGKYESYDTCRGMKENEWYGRVLLDENGHFEGVVCNDYSQPISLLVGNTDGCSLEVLKLNKNKGDFPMVFRGNLSDYKFKGLYSYIMGCYDFPIEGCTMSINDAELTRNVISEEMTFVKRNASILKECLTKDEKEICNLYFSRNNKKNKEKIKQN